MDKRRQALLGILVMVGLLTACAHQPEVGRFVEVPGFFKGWWHGLIVPFSFVGSIFAHVRFYAWPNSGVWYDFGFLLGIGVWGGGAAASRRSRCHDRPRSG